MPASPKATPTLSDGGHPKRLATPTPRAPALRDHLTNVNVAPPVASVMPGTALGAPGACGSPRNTSAVSGSSVKRHREPALPASMWRSPGVGEAVHRPPMPSHRVAQGIAVFLESFRQAPRVARRPTGNGSCIDPCLVVETVSEVRSTTCPACRPRSPDLPASTAGHRSNRPVTASRGRWISGSSPSGAAFDDALRYVQRVAACTGPTTTARCARR